MSDRHIQFAATVRLLPAPDIHPLHPHSHYLLGVILDQHGCSASQDLARSHNSADHGYSVVRYRAMGMVNVAQYQKYKYKSTKNVRSKKYTYRKIFVYS